MQTRVKWIDHMSFVAESGSGHSVVMDGAPESGGRDLAARPMEMVLMGLGGCSSYDMVSMLKKARQPLESLEVHVEATRVDAVPAVYDHPFAGVQWRRNQRRFRHLANLAKKKQAYGCVIWQCVIT